MNLLKKIIIYPIIGLFTLAGGANVMDSTIHEVWGHETSQTITMHEHHEESEGEMQLGIATLIFLLNNFLSGKEKAEKTTQTMDVHVQTNFTREDHKAIDQCFRHQELNFQQIIQNELYEPFASSFKILELDFRYHPKELLATITSEVPKLHHDKKSLFENHIRKVITHLLEQKVEHIQEKFAEDPDGLTPVIISSAFDEQMEQVRLGKKLLGHIFHSNK
jgi:hypothetical protein